jgi:hypothetical protein
VNQKALESLKHQYTFHIKQKEIVKLKKMHYEKYKKAIEHQKQKMIDSFQNLEPNERLDNSNNLQISIYKTMDETDLLLEQMNFVNLSETESGKSGDSPTDPTAEAKAKQKSKQSAAIDELKNLNHKLHILVYKLISQMDETVQENLSLKAKLRAFEKPHDSPVSAQLTDRPYKLSVNIDEEKCTNLNQYSLSSDISPEDGIEAHEIELAPLDLPTFDLSELNESCANK